jgi:hypothetical protein
LRPFCVVHALPSSHFRVRPAESCMTAGGIRSWAVQPGSSQLRRPLASRMVTGFPPLIGEATRGWGTKATLRRD